MRHRLAVGAADRPLTRLGQLTVMAEPRHDAKANGPLVM